MYPADRSLNRQIQLLIYSMKREYGGTIDIYKLESTDTNVRTGVKTISKTLYHIDRAVVAPGRLKRDVKQSISLISANKQLVQGGWYDFGTRDFIVDRRDVPDLPQLTQDDWLVYNDRKYQIAEVQEFEFDAGWIITARELSGEVPEQMYLVASDHYLEVTQTATGEL